MRSRTTPGSGTLDSSAITRDLTRVGCFELPKADCRLRVARGQRGPDSPSGWSRTRVVALSHPPSLPEGRARGSRTETNGPVCAGLTRFGFAFIIVMIERVSRFGPLRSLMSFRGSAWKRLGRMALIALAILSLVQRRPCPSPTSTRSAITTHPASSAKNTITSSAGTLMPRSRKTWPSFTGTGSYRRPPERIPVRPNPATPFMPTSPTGRPKPATTRLRSCPTGS